MGNFNVKFGIDTNYFDPEYRSLYVKVIGETSVTVEGRDGSEDDKEFVKTLITLGINKALMDLSSQKVTVKTLVEHQVEIKNAINEAFAEQKVTASSINIMSINPDERSRERMSKLDEMKKMSSMSPEELAKLQQEKVKQAQAIWDKMTPEEKARAQEEAKKKADEAAEKMRQAQALAAKMAPSSAAGQAADIATQMAAMKAATFDSPAPLKKFCSNCGAPAGLGKFCGECGKPL